MRILHVLSQTQPTGAETYALALAERQLSAGHQVWVVSDKLHFPTKAAYVPLAVHNRRYLQRLRNIKSLRALIQREAIDLVHAHSRAASWVSYYSTLGLPTAYLSTVHGRQHLHASVRFHDIYGDRVIAICENLRTHLAEEVAMDPSKIRMIPNGVDFAEIDAIRKSVPPPAGDRFNMAIAGRTTGPKGERAGEILERVIPRVLEKFPQVEFEIFGGEVSHLPAEAQKKLAELQAKYPRRVKTRGFLSGREFYEALARQNLVFGSGRVAMYSARLGATVVSVGESDAPGLLRASNLSQSWCSNFGDIDGDGLLDIYLGTGEPSLASLVPNRMFRNLGGGRFADVSSATRTGHLQKGHGVSFGDWDRDGDQDILVELGGSVPGDRYHTVLFQNPGNPGAAHAWITLKLVGVRTNRAAIGARIKVVTEGDPPLAIHRHVSTGSSFGANPLEQTIGLGRARRIALLEIRWPTSGTTQVFRDVPVGGMIEVTESRDSWRSVATSRIELPR
ncbi:MAG: glycosyltransferase [Bdellovibrionales bacterium]|nr:glycosyltransferase [Bdellovibrionales bacterium]